MRSEDIETIATGFAIFVTLVPIVGFLLVAFWFVTLVKHLGSSKGDSDRLTWTLVLIFLNWIGAILYWTVRSWPSGKQTDVASPRSPHPFPANPRPLTPPSTPSVPAEQTVEDMMDSIDPDWRYKPAGYQAKLRLDASTKLEIKRRTREGSAQ